MSRTNQDAEEFLNEGEWDACSLYDQRQELEIELTETLCNQLVTPEENNE